MTPPREVSTDQRLLVAAYRLAHENNLPHQVDIERAVRTHDHKPLPRLVNSYLAAADLVATSSPEPQSVPKAILRASDLACDIRLAAQGMRGPAPTRSVWSVLVTILTVLTLSSRTSEDRAALAERVGALTLTLGEL